MITYVNTVLVSNAPTALATHVDGSSIKSNVTGDAGKIAFMDLTDGEPVYEIPTDYIPTKFKIGVVTNKQVTIVKGGTTTYIPIVKWSNEIKTADIKSISYLDYEDSSEDIVKINFGENMPSSDLLARGGFPIIVRLSFKDMPTRYRQWSESYDYYVQPSDSANNIAAAFAEIINRQSKRARVNATASSGTLILTALPYTDNESADSENFHAKVRFNATAWYSDPLLPGFESNNKYSLGKISKTEGSDYAASAKNVRDRERTAQGYQGILNRSDWYDVKPEMMVDMTGTYSAITLEFENMYRAADDIFRKTKQTVEIYGNTEEAATIGGGLLSALTSWVDGSVYVAEESEDDNSSVVPGGN